MEPSLLGPETLIRGAIRSRTAPAPTLCFGCFARAGWLATWCSITSSPAEQAATTASLGAARRAVNGRSRPENALRAVNRAAHLGSSFGRIEKRYSVPPMTQGADSLAVLSSAKNRDDVGMPIQGDRLTIGPIRQFGLVHLCSGPRDGACEPG